MSVWSRSAPSVAALSLTLTLALTGCGDSFFVGPMSYVENDRLKTELKDKPELQTAVRKGLVTLFGPDPKHIEVPEGAGLPLGGLRLASHVDQKGKIEPVQRPSLIGGSAVVDAAGKPVTERQEGGYALYRKHCLHCHGVSGAGDGPTGTFLFPRPRDYRKGMYKFTSTNNGAKPTRDDLRKTVREGLHGTSMPAFEALMTDDEMDQVIDYTIFLSMRGETELALIDEAAVSGEITPDVLSEISKAIFGKWAAAADEVVAPGPVVPSSPESILRGRDLYLGTNATGNKIACTSCHGNKALGDGPSFVAQDVYNQVVFGGNITKQFKLTSGELVLVQSLTDLEASKTKPTWANLVAAFKKDAGITGEEKVEELVTKTGYDELNWEKATAFPQLFETMVNDLETKMLVSHGMGLGGTVYHSAIDGKAGKLWNDSLDEWGNPLRPANLNRGVYKGGRRPIDLYWRIAKGINGAKMPAHSSVIEPDKIWDVVNFVLALPYQPELLEGIKVPEPTVPPPAVANR